MVKALDKKWLVFYTKPRAEKKTDELLKKLGFNSYLPVQTILRQWSDRKKKVITPLFNSYIFVNEHESRIPDILQVPGVVWNIRYLDKPAILRDEEMNTIRRFIETGYFIETTSANELLKKGDKVEIIDGPLRGMIGILTKEYNEEKFSTQ